MHLLQTPLKDTRSLSQKALGNARALPLAALLISTLLLTNLLQLLSPILLIFSKKVFRSFNRFCAGSWCKLAAWVTKDVCGFQLVLTGDDLPDSENALVIANHQEMPDILVLLLIADRKKRVADLKWFAKNAIKFVPGVGWGMAFLDCIFLNRNWADDRSRIQASFKKYQKEKIPFWLVLFPEGTRIRVHKLKTAAEFAARRGFPVPEHVLLPKPRGFAAALSGLRTEAKAVYDLSLAYSNGVPNLLQILNGAATGARLDIRRFAVESLPNQEREIAEWLRWRFTEKDKLLGSIFKGSGSNVTGRDC